MTTMDPLVLAALLFGIGVALIVAEMFLPGHGMIGVLGALAILGAVGVCFRVNQWLGLGVLVGVLLLSPLAVTIAVKIYPRTPLGRRMILPPIENPSAAAAVKLGQVGVALSELRPIGVCDFGEQRVEVLAEHGLVRPGTKVQVVAIINNRPTVRAIEAPASPGQG